MMISASQVQAVSKITGMFARAFTIGVGRFLCESPDPWPDKHSYGFQSVFSVKGDLEGYIVALYTMGVNEHDSSATRVVFEPKLAKAIFDIYKTENGQTPDPFGIKIAINAMECNDINNLLYGLRKSTTFISLIIQTGNYRVDFYVTKLANTD